MTENELKDIFSRNFNYFFDASGLTQQELADQLEARFNIRVSQPTVNSWRKGDKMPRPIVVQQIGEFFGVDAGYLLSDHTLDHLTTYKSAEQTPFERDLALATFEDKKLIQKYLSIKEPIRKAKLRSIINSILDEI